MRAGGSFVIACGREERTDRQGQCSEVYCSVIQCSALQCTEVQHSTVNCIAVQYSAGHCSEAFCKVLSAGV